ncbi:FAD dependent oxidoreductase [Piedraia hortae CBS 480.64]|uniref:FAD dependent oxidoreductase n=1 Tax=Piedraia hortae CBS 480.64 TaxID=1314780 RepID=A0A6A7C9J8_9PEZI|nr:FAD dependent oxidoreductase [Piedraia hortae CBS 480.64]
MSSVVVIGAGVTGLAISLLLAKAGYAVTLLAEHLPGSDSIDYTSAWAGAQWRTHASPSSRERGWDIQTYQYWMSLTEEAGVARYTSRLFFPGLVTEEEIWFAPHVLDFRTLLDQVEFTSFTLTPQKYLAYLLAQAEGCGMRVIQTKLPGGGSVEGGSLEGESVRGVSMERGNLETLLSAASHLASAEVYVNATGLAAPDPTLFPIRGVTLRVKGEASHISTKLFPDGGIGYVLPRKGTGESILGGTKEVGVASREVGGDVVDGIKDRCRDLAPELLTDGEFEVLGVQVGFRPGRVGGARVEGEVLADGKRVVHAYGHGGAGFQNSVGCANEVVRLIGELLLRS